MKRSAGLALWAWVWGVALGHGEVLASPTPRVIQNIWWNQPKQVEALALTPAQRGAMDERLQTFLLGRAGAPKHQRKLLAEVGLALTQPEVDVEAVRKSGAALAREMREPIAQQIELMVEVSAILTPEQRQRVRDAFPRLFSRLWIRSTASPGAPLALGGRGRR